MRIAALIGAILLILFAVFQDGPESATTADETPMFDIRTVEIVGQLTYADEAELQRFYNQLLGEGLFDRSMAQLQAFATEPQWVKSAQIRRLWPHTLRIEVTEHRPLARWNDGKVITAEGQVIAPSKGPELPLTWLRGPVDTEEAVLDQFSLVSQMLSTSSLRVSELALEDRGAWSIKFANGIAVKLGRDQILDRLQRFVAVYKTDLSGRIDRIISVDARYPHGVAVKWTSDE
ncbi:cell division protein FtsQ/DivIB [Marinomonas ostreistagni]|uniref:cell division protein FtsQ/DivIB n=1 Tax=Marinomonas ostreistagni TaxID=359209 RepID=UPI00194E130B|nr:cell division protein FtsQ/DivIB [Marinomonas ostreistagni]MBM6549753.1 cell division protein FtsQ/DivIB [Marinomonas ostreistagni]